MTGLLDSEDVPSGGLTLQEVLDFVSSQEARADGVGTLTSIFCAAGATLIRLYFQTHGELPAEGAMLSTFEPSATPQTHSST